MALPNEVTVIFTPATALVPEVAVTWLEHWEYIVLVIIIVIKKHAYHFTLLDRR